MGRAVLMPLINSSFALGHADECIRSFSNRDEGAIAAAELAYFQGRPEDALRLASPYVRSLDIGLRSSASLICIYANLPLGRTAQSRYVLDQLEEQLAKTSEQERPFAQFARDSALTLLHLGSGTHTAPSAVAQHLGEGTRLFYAYVRAHQAYLDGAYGYSLGIAEGAMAMATATYPIPLLYLSLVSCMSALSLKRIDYAKQLFRRAWELARPDDLIQGIAEHHGLLGGLIETCIKPNDPQLYRRIIDITYRFSAGWRRVHNPRSEEEIADNLTTTEFSIAMLLNRNWTIKEISAYLEVSENTVKTHAKSIYRKLGINSRKELSRFMLR